MPHPERTIACPANMIGQWLAIHGIGERRCEDTGGAITEGRIDVYLADYNQALKFGKRTVTYSVK